MKNKKLSSVALWAGTEESLYEHEARAETGLSMDAKVFGSSEGDSGEEYPYLLERFGNTAVIQISGALTNSDAWYNSFLKIPSYNAIKEALVYAATDQGVEQILLNINSGGGPVAGIADTADLIKKIDTEVKPVYAYTESLLASAAYWLASSTDKVFASALANVGSIGVIATHIEYSKQMDDVGMKATIIRAGKYKALASAYEPLTEEAKTIIQTQIDAVYNIFVQTVADNRGQTFAHTDTIMAQGREFLGASAKNVNLVDGITSLDKLMSQLENTSLDNQSDFRQTSQKSTNGVNHMKKRLSAKDIALIAAGGTVAVSAESDEVVTETTTEATTEAVVATETVVETDANKGTEEVTEIKNETGIVALLQTQLKESNEALIEARVEIAGLKSKTVDSTETVSALTEIAAASANNMRIALGQASLDMAALSTAEVLNAHKTVSADFTKQFSVGGVAAVVANDKSAETKSNISNTGLHKARVAAAGFKSN